MLEVIFLRKFYKEYSLQVCEKEFIHLVLYYLFHTQFNFPITQKKAKVNRNFKNKEKNHHPRNLIIT